MKYRIKYVNFLTPSRVGIFKYYIRVHHSQRKRTTVGTFVAKRPFVCRD